MLSMFPILPPRVSTASFLGSRGLFGLGLGAALTVCACGEANKQPLLPDSEHAEAAPDASAPLEPPSPSGATPASTTPASAK